MKTEYILLAIIIILIIVAIYLVKRSEKNRAITLVLLGNMKKENCDLKAKYEESIEESNTMVDVASAETAEALISSDNTVNEVLNAPKLQEGTQEASIIEASDGFNSLLGALAESQSLSLA